MSSYNLYDYISTVIKDSIYFGPIPDKQMMNILSEEGFNLIVDLTEQHERFFLPTLPTLTSLRISLGDNHSFWKLSYPIHDRSVPNDVEEYFKVLNFILQQVKNNKKLYIHCRAGHSRSSMLCMSLITILNSLDIEEAIKTISDIHNNRVHLNPAWKTKTTPLNIIQLEFLKKTHIAI